MVLVRSVLRVCAQLTYVENTQASVCESTTGVHQVSGYVTVGNNMNMWFWFFGARNLPQTAPFTLWLNGGPGYSSMVGAFAENGPCKVLPGGHGTVLNEYSWNEVSNMIYIDQPIGVGFSYGDNTASDTPSAATFVWNALQALFEGGILSDYQSRQFNIAGESFAGHYIPEFATYFSQQNEKIDTGTLHGAVKLNLYSVMINNGLIDPLIQSQTWIDFLANAPGYGQLISDDEIKYAQTDYFKPSGCYDQGKACYATGNSISSEANRTCALPTETCFSFISKAASSWNKLDLRKSQNVEVPSTDFVTYLQQESVTSVIGAKTNFATWSKEINDMFIASGDMSRTYLPELGKLADSGLKILIWAGDADLLCNWVGIHTAISQMEWSGKNKLANTPFTNMTMGGRPIAAIQNVDNFSFARVYDAGHIMPGDQPAAALEIFTQVIRGQPLHSV